jgi:hypothetical protein
MLCSLDRIQSVRLRKEVNELVTWSVSLRDIYADLQMKEVLTKHDSRGMAAINVGVGPAPDTIMATTGSVHYHEVTDALSHNSWGEALKYIPRLGDDNGLNTKTILMNQVTYKEFAKWTPLEGGEEFTTDIMKNGITLRKLTDLNIIVTIKRSLVPDGTVYHFGDPDFIGRNYVWKQPTMLIKQEDHSVEFSVFTERGGALVNFLGIARVDYTQV